jgi:hypothetical protein
VERSTRRQKASLSNSATALSLCRSLRRCRETANSDRLRNQVARMLMSAAKRLPLSNTQA